MLGTLSTMTAGFVSERRERTRVAEHNDLLEQRVRERTAELRDTQLEIVRRLGQAVESRDGDTGEHIERISRLCQQLALALGLSEAEAELIGHASTMHDVGKIGIPDSVLLKPSRLDPDEWALMQSHTTIGAAILAGSSSPLLQTAESIALTHHERWDGTGYPAGLRGDAIPLAARICAVCDVFDALLSKRRYKRSWTMEEAIAELAGPARPPLRPGAGRRLRRARARPGRGVAHRRGEDRASACSRWISQPRRPRPLRSARGRGRP